MLGPNSDFFLKPSFHSQRSSVMTRLCAIVSDYAKVISRLQYWPAVWNGTEIGLLSLFDSAFPQWMIRRCPASICVQHWGMDELLYLTSLTKTDERRSCCSNRESRQGPSGPRTTTLFTEPSFHPAITLSLSKRSTSRVIHLYLMGLSLLSPLYRLHGNTAGCLLESQHNIIHGWSRWQSLYPTEFFYILSGISAAKYKG